MPSWNAKIRITFVFKLATLYIFSVRVVFTKSLYNQQQWLHHRFVRHITYYWRQSESAAAVASATTARHHDIWCRQRVVFVFAERIFKQWDNLCVCVFMNSTANRLLTNKMKQNNLSGCNQCAVAAATVIITTIMTNNNRLECIISYIYWMTDILCNYTQIFIYLWTKDRINVCATFLRQNLNNYTDFYC